MSLCPSVGVPLRFVVKDVIAAANAVMVYHVRVAAPGGVGVALDATVPVA
jgi:hypothetical protein